MRPTSEQVCEALSEFFKEKVVYIKDEYKDGFIFENSLMFIVRLSRLDKFRLHFADGTFLKVNDLSPDILITLGEFYKEDEATKQRGALDIKAIITRFLELSHVGEPTESELEEYDDLEYQLDQFCEETK